MGYYGEFYAENDEFETYPEDYVFDDSASSEDYEEAPSQPPPAPFARKLYNFLRTPMVWYIAGVGDAVLMFLIFKYLL